MPGRWISELADVAGQGAVCDGCGAPAVQAVEWEFERGGRLWCSYCQACWERESAKVESDKE